MGDSAARKRLRAAACYVADPSPPPLPFRGPLPPPLCPWGRVPWAWGRAPGRDVKGVVAAGEVGEVGERRELAEGEGQGPEHQPQPRETGHHGRALGGGPGGWRSGFREGPVGEGRRAPNGGMSRVGFGGAEGGMTSDGAVAATR